MCTNKCLNRTIVQSITSTSQPEVPPLGVFLLFGVNIQSIFNQGLLFHGEICEIKRHSSFHCTFRSRFFFLSFTLHPDLFFDWFVITNRTENFIKLMKTTLIFITYKPTDR